MTLKFKSFEEEKQNFADVSKNGTEEEQAEALNNMLQALAKDTQDKIMNQVNSDITDKSVLLKRGQNVLTNEERQFFTNVIEEGGFTDDDILPKTTQERVFEDLVDEHPLLEALELQDLGAVTEFIFSDPEGAAVWGRLHSEIKGQLNASFEVVDIAQKRLTAFIPISKDMLQLGPEWVEQYVREMLEAAIAVGLERGFVEGTGNNEPIGLLKDPDGGTNSDGEYYDKESSGTLTFGFDLEGKAQDKKIVQDMAKAVKELTIRELDETGAPMNKTHAGRITMLVNPFDSVDIQAVSTVRNSNGDFVQSLPYNPRIIESRFVPEGKVVFFIRGRYIAAMGGGYQMNRYNETLALENADLFIAKQFATGMPVDEQTSRVFDLEMNSDNGGEG